VLSKHPEAGDTQLPEAGEATAEATAEATGAMGEGGSSSLSAYAMRGRVPSKRMVAREAPSEAAKRGVHETLGGLLMPTDPIEVAERVVVWQEREESQRFPGMDSAYELHLVDVYVMGLPLEPFTTSDFTDGARVGTLHWEWHDAQSTAAPPGAMPYTPPT